VGIATAWLVFDLQNAPEERTCLQRVFQSFYRGLVDPDFVFFAGQGQGWEVLEASVDRDGPWIGIDEAPHLFPGEYEVPGTNLTKLHRSGERPCAREREDAMLDAMVERFELAKEAEGCDYAGAYVWGTTHIHYLTSQGTLDRDWFLREKLRWVDGAVTYYPILRADVSFSWSPSRVFQLRLSYNSRLWSEYDDPVPMHDPSEWPKKEDTRAARANCVMLAERTAAFFSLFPGATVGWGDESDHLPPIQGLLVPELEKRIGPQGTDIQL